ncbi:hypothetical protein ACJX0J_023815, partial [Zea mays]
GGAAPNGYQRTRMMAREIGTHGHKFLGLLTPEGLALAASNIKASKLKSLGFSFHNESDGLRNLQLDKLMAFFGTQMGEFYVNDAFKWVLAVVYGPAQVDKKELSLKNKPLIYHRWPFLFNVVIDGLNLKEIETDGFHDMFHDIWTNEFYSLDKKAEFKALLREEEIKHRKNMNEESDFLDAYLQIGSLMGDYFT